jgi:hypothetical protein
LEHVRDLNRRHAAVTDAPPKIRVVVIGVKRLLSVGHGDLDVSATGLGVPVWDTKVEMSRGEAHLLVLAIAGVIVTPVDLEGVRVAGVGVRERAGQGDRVASLIIVAFTVRLVNWGAVLAVATTLQVEPRRSRAPRASGLRAARTDLDSQRRPYRNAC